MGLESRQALAGSSAQATIWVFSVLISFLEFRVLFQAHLLGGRMQSFAVVRWGLSFPVGCQLGNGLRSQGPQSSLPSGTLTNSNSVPIEGESRSNVLSWDRIKRNTITAVITTLPFVALASPPLTQSNG